MPLVGQPSNQFSDDIIDISPRLFAISFNFLELSFVYSNSQSSVNPFLRICCTHSSHLIGVYLLE